MSQLHPVGDGGDIRVVFDHVMHLVADVRAGDAAHALTHLWPILEELRKAIGPAVYGSSAGVTVEVQAVTKEIEQLQAQAQAGALPADWRAILRDLLLRLLPLLF